MAYVRTKKRSWFSVLILGLICVGLLSFLTLRYLLPDHSVNPPEVVEIQAEIEKSTISGAQDEPLAKKELADLIGSRLIDDEGQTIEISDQEGGLLYVRTTLDPELQKKASAWVSRSQAHQAALVLMNPNSGEVLVLAAYDAKDTHNNAALAGSFPAASLFKIVTAAAAVEKAELSASSTVAYDGGKHTLFKGNVTQDTDKGQNAATLEESFAESINTVFGKLGAYTLKPEDLNDFANRFKFNSNIAFEMPVERSHFELEKDDDDPYRIAELASGFNRVTTVSPLHGAMLASAVVAGGGLWEPTFVKEVFDRENKIFYQAQTHYLGEAISPETAQELSHFMEAAIHEGTGRRSFSDADNHATLSKLRLGGKSGTINNTEGNKVDWFVAWAKPKDKKKSADSLALAAVVVHGGTTTTTSQKLVREALLAYYKNKL